jgi:uncharacterized membrane protein
MTDPLRWPYATLAGLACSMRTFAGPGLLAVHGRITGVPRAAVLIAAAGELAGDKSSKAPDRTDPPGLAGRVASGVYTGREIAGGTGAAAGAIAAVLGTFATRRARSLVVEVTGLPDPVVGAGEDIVAEALAALATRPDSERPEPETGREPGEIPGGDEPRGSLRRDLLTGVAAGVAGTAAMTIAQGAKVALTDAEPSSTPADVADRLKRKAGRGRLKRKHRRAANQGMHWLYGVSWGVPYGIVAGPSKVAPEVSGPAFGLLVWGAGLAHQPALGVAEPPWKRSPASLGSEALFHLVYGLGAGAALRCAR